MVLGKTGLWSDVLQQRYMRRECDSILSSRKGDSPVWKFICAQSSVINMGTKWQVRNDNLVNFFTDQWLINGQKLEDFCKRPLTEFEEASTVADCTINGSWDFNRLQGILVPEVCNRLLASLPPRPTAGNDLMIWGPSGDGVFSIRSAYFLIEKNPPNPHQKLFKGVWKWGGAEKIRVFLWKVALNKLPTNQWRATWAQASASCSFCHNGVEDILHILRDCPYAKNMWIKLIQQRYVSSFFSAGLKDWVAMNLKRRMGKEPFYCWQIVFGVAVWKLWEWRNQYIFEDNFSKPAHPEVVIPRIWSAFAMVCEPVLDPAILTDQNRLCWRKPDANWLKINVDGAVNRRSGMAGCGGVIRNESGAWVAGFSKHLGICDSLLAELWAIKKGLLLAWDMGCRQGIVESDTIEAISIIHQRQDASSSLLVCDIRELLERTREINRIADALAKTGISKSSLLDACPTSLRGWVEQESLGLISPSL